MDYLSTDFDSNVGARTALKECLGRYVHGKPKPYMTEDSVDYKYLCQQLIEANLCSETAPKEVKLPEIVWFRNKGQYRSVDDQSWGPKENVWCYLCPTVGSIISYGTDRALNWDHGVVVGVDWKRGLVGVIYPRFKFVWNEDTKSVQSIIFGGDRLSEPNYDYPAKCVCEIYQGCDFLCRCGAEDKNAQAYQESFEVADSPTQTYQVCWLDIREEGYVWLESDSMPSQKEWLPKCMPMQRTSCLACRDSHA
jgi:hypothetical protein